VLDAARSLLAGAPEDLGLAFGVAVALAALFLTWAVRGLRRAEAAGG